MGAAGIKKTALWLLRPGLLVVFGIGLVLWALVLGTLPPTERDALIHHLAIPKLWLEAGRFVETPWAYFSYYPMNLDLLYLAPLAAGKDWIAHWIHLGFGLMTTWLIYIFLRRRLRSESALVGALLFFSTPMVLRLATSAYVDLGLTFFLTAAVLSLTRYMEARGRLYLFISAFFMGLAMGTKYQGLIALPIMLLGVVWSGYQLHQRREETSTDVSLYGLVAGLIFFPWAAKNYFLTGNPLYPLFNGFWGLPAVIPPRLNVDLFTFRDYVYHESFWEVLMIPVRFFFQGRDYDARLFDGVLNPGLIILPLAGLLSSGRREVYPFLLIVVFWVLTVFFRGAAVVRYIVPILPLLAILSAYGLENLWNWAEPLKGERFFKGVIVAGTAALLLVNGLWAVHFWQGKHPGGYLRGRETRQEYLEKQLGYYPAVEFVNSRLPEDSRLLLLFIGNQGYYFERALFLLHLAFRRSSAADYNGSHRAERYS